jgi:hypothetical protein
MAHQKEMSFGLVFVYMRCKNRLHSNKPTPAHPKMTKNVHDFAKELQAFLLANGFVKSGRGISLTFTNGDCKLDLSYCLAGEQPFEITAADYLERGNVVASLATEVAYNTVQCFECMEDDKDDRIPDRVMVTFTNVSATCEGFEPSDEAKVMAFVQSYAR